MTEEMTLWDMGVEDTTISEEEKKKEAQAQAKANAKTYTPTPKQKEEPILVNAEWTIHFASEVFTVSDFVTEIPEEGISLEELRENIERHFPNFSAARTKWDIDKDKKLLFPDAFAGSKGSVATKEGRFTPSFFVTAEQAFESNKVYRYILSGDGNVLAVHQSAIGTLITPTTNVDSDMLSAALSELGYSKLSECPITPASFEWALPKMPNKILRQIVGFFRSYVKEDSEYEVALKVFWDTQKKKFVVDCPKQVVTAVRIELEYNNEFTGQNAMRYIPVLEVHSHNVMRAFFSAIDDSDEQAFNTSFGVFGVFGRLNRQNYETVFRAKMRNTTFNLPLEQLFEVEVDIKDYSFPKHWKSNVTTKGGF